MTRRALDGTGCRAGSQAKRLVPMMFPNQSEEVVDKLSSAT
jgi:hypothetical protein